MLDKHNDPRSFVVRGFEERQPVKPTARPWRLEQETPAHGCDIFGSAETDSYIATTSGNARANAALIVKAVNSFEPLVNAVKELLSTYPINEKFEPACEGELRMANAVTDALAALRLAETEGAQ